MNPPNPFYKVIAAVIFASCFAATPRPQEPSALKADMVLPEPVRTTLYPEVLCVGCVVPNWDRGYLLHKEVDKDPAVVTMYDAEGKKILTGRISAPDSSNVWVIGVAATHEGGILAGAAGNMTDGSRKGFVARTDRRGRTVQSVATVNFEPDRVCEAADGTIWALGSAWDEDKNVLRHYSFEKGLLGGFIPLKYGTDAALQVSSGGKSYLHCGEDRVSVYLGLSRRYIEVNTSTGRLSSWNVDTSSAIGDKPRGLAVTDDYRVFLVFARNNSRSTGLYELRATEGTPTASLTAVDGTIEAKDTDDAVTKGNIYRLFGAEGDELVVQRHGEWPGISWVKVVSSR